MTRSEALHQRVMREILFRVQDTPYVLKGGTALLFTRHLDRHSTDLDFDSAKPINIEGRIRDGLRAAGVKLLNINKVKDTATVQRYKIHYLDPVEGEDCLLKVETSFRAQPKDENIEVVNGIRTYDVAQMYDLKMNAIDNRTEARDLYDLAHLLRFYGDQFSFAQIARAEAFSRDMDDLATRYASSFETDDVLSKLSKIDDTVIVLREAVEQQLQRLRESQPPKSNANMVLQICLKFLQLVGQPIERGVRFEGNCYIFIKKAEDISIKAKDGRGVIFEVSKGQVNSKMLPEDIQKIQELDQHIEAFKQHRPERLQQSQPELER